MELKLEVVVSSSIKRKKPWPRFCWLGQEKESVFLLDDKRISEINMVSGRTRKRTPKLHHLLNSVVTMASSHNGLWLCGLLLSGELFLWNKDKDLLKTAAAVPEIAQTITSSQGTPPKFSVQVSGDAKRVLLVAKTGLVFLWECEDVKDLTGPRDGAVRGRWVHIQPLESTVLPSSQDKDTAQHILFAKTEEIGDTCLLAFVFTSGKKLVVTFLKILWEEGRIREGSVAYSVHWATKTYPLSQLMPPCQAVKSRGALVPAFSPDGKLLAVVLNQRKPKATQILFVSTQNFVSLSSDLGGCGSKKLDIPSKYIRSYWVSSVSWSPGGLFLACVLKRGSLLMVARLGGLLTLTSSGCSVDFGPAQFLPLHPLVTYRPPISAGRSEASLSSSSLSVRDVLRQRYSVTWHRKLLYLIVSDGYMVTVLRVPDRPSPGLVLRALLKDVSKDLNKASRTLDKSQIHAKPWLESLSYLNMDSSLEQLSPTVKAGLNTTDLFASSATDGDTLPPFLQDQRTLGGTKELFESFQAFFEEDSDVDGLPVGSHAEDDGRLEFASMFDTLHAQDTRSDGAIVPSPTYEEDFVETEKRTLLYCQLQRIQKRLLTAWAFAMSLGNAIEHRPRLLRHTLCCVVRLSALLRCISNPAVTAEGSNNSPKLLHLIESLLTFLPWDSAPSDGPRCLGLMVEFSKHLIQLLLTPQLDSRRTRHRHLSSLSLSEALYVLQMLSDSLDRTYNLQQRTHWSSAEKERPSEPLQLWLSDEHHVPLLQEEEEETSGCEVKSRPAPQRPSTRLLGVYQMLYSITKQYGDEVNRFAGCDGWEEEVQQLSVIMSHIQTAVQATGERLEEGPGLLSYAGEHLFLSGSYSQSAQLWQLQLCEENIKSHGRSVFQETRLCLALLYSLLSQYNLKEAQELGDHMAQLVLYRAGHLKSCLTDSLPCPWLPVELCSDAACAVIQTLGRFMASYFTNQPLHILPPHNVAVLPPLHLPHDASFGRLVPLSQEEVARAIRQQHLSQVWTVDYAQDLLLLGGLLPEAAWLAYNLGDWKTAVSLSLAYTSYCADHFDFTGLRRRELHLPAVLKPENIFQEELESLLYNTADSNKCTDTEDDKSLTDLLDGEDWDLLQVSIQEVLKASVIAGVNVISSPVSSLLDAAKDLCASLPALVPTGLYLPSPPLYCPQPSPNTQDQIRKMGQFAEVSCRHKVSGVLQRLMLLLRSGHCCYPAAQWYISHLRRARHLLHKIKRKYPYPAEDEKTLPEGLMKLITRSGFFRRGPKKDGHLDPDTIQIIICFRELCALCWMLHVRDQLSISCRKYQSARQHSRDEEVNSACVEALRWAGRFLPFCRFLNADEILQDVLLSLVSELPPVPLVAETLVRAFPEEEESVRVPLREKYNSLVQRLRQCHVVEEEKEEESELMMILIQDKSRQRKKHLRRLQRHMAPHVLHLWEKEEEEEDRGSKHGMAMLRQLSLGTSLSTSTLADYGFPPVCSDGDTGENTSEAISPELPSKATTRDKRAKKVKGKEHTRKKAVKIKSAIQEEIDQSKAKDSQQPSLPVVGTWEFELEDDEYLTFLELFLSYVLEKDSRDGADSTNEPPLLKDFCSEIRERELHSLTFDVLTTIHRRQRDGHHPARKHSSYDPPVFRAGCCYKPVKRGPTTEPRTSSVCSEAPVSRSSFSFNSQPPWRTGEQKGLFGLRQRSGVPANQRERENLRGSESIHSGFITEKTSYGFISGTSVNMEAVAELQQGLDPKLEAQFPKLGRLLEWMVRWADRRALVGHLGKKNKLAGGVADEGVVIRVKASAPAVLTALSLLEDRFTALLGTDRHSAHIQVPRVECIAVPALQPEAERPPERESSVDTGYPGSANTPTNVLGHNPQQEEQSDSCTDDPEELAFHGASSPTHQDQLISDAELRQSDLQQPTFDDLDVTPEKEGTSSRSVGPEASSSCASDNIFGDVGTPDMSLKLADLDLSERVQDVPNSPSLLSDAENTPAPPHQGVPAPPSDQPQAAAHTQVPGPSETTEPPNVPQHSSTTQAPNQAADTVNPPVRQNLGEDLFRLIQHINFMGLREVLQASFTNMQLAQQSSALNIPNVPLSSTPHLIPEPNVSAIQPTIPQTPQTNRVVPKPVTNDPQISQTPDCVLAHQPAAQSSAAHECHTCGTVPPSASGAGVNYQEMKPLSVQAGSPNSPLRRARGLIPSSQGLLATTDTSVPSNNHGQNTSIPQIMGLKTLHLPQPSLSQQGAHYPAPNKHFDQAAPVKRGRDKTGGPSVPREPLHNVWQTEQPRNQGVSVLPSMLAPPTAAPPQGVRLLQFNPEKPLSNITFPKLPLTTSSRPPTVIEAPMTGTSMIKLLRIESGPKVMLPPATLSTQMSHLMSLEKVSRSVMGRQSAEESGRQLLRAEPSNEGTTKTILSSGLNTSKRQKRREKARQAEVTFRPNDSIIPSQEPTDVPENEQPAAAEVITSGQDVSIPSGHPDSSLTGQRLLDRAMATSAELHAFAATCKNPPERHDAFTNTDPDCPPVFVDKAVSAQVSVLASSPKSQGSFQIDNEDPVRDTGRTPHEPEGLVDIGGRQFISVLDLEDVRQHQSVRQSPSSAAQEAPTIVPLSPTPAQLHFMAASVITRGSAAAPADDSQPSVTVPGDLLKPTTHPDNSVETPSVSHNGSRMVSEQLTSPEERFFVPDPSHSEICRAIKTTSAGPGRAAPSPPAAWFSSHLSELDGQLAALQNIADRLEKDFFDSRMLVNNIEELTAAEHPDVKTTSTAKKTVRLSVPLKAWEARPDPDPLPEMSLFEEEDENQEDESHHLRMKDQLPEEEDDISQAWSDKYLDQAELCDTVEILDELVKEGYLSPTELDLSTLRTVPQSRPQEQPESSWMSQERVLPEDERRELRMWMRRKQRERLAAYQKQRETLRERERKPFPSSAALQSTNRNRKTASRTKEQEREMLLEQYNQRTREACSLANKVLTSPGTQRRSLRPDGLPAATTRSTSAPPPGSTQSVPASDRRNLRSQSGQASPHFRAWSADVHDQPSEDHRRRLGLHRPVTILPKDRLSQVTKRGMLTAPKNHKNLHPAGEGGERGVGQQKKTGLNRTFTRGAAAGRGSLKEQAREEDVDTLAGLMEQQDHGSRMDWLAQISGSASSSLSKIDWTTIERMVAEEEEEDEVSQ